MARSILRLDKIDSAFITDLYHDGDHFDLKSCPLVSFKSLGSENKDKHFYVIYCNQLGGGFFANVRHVVGNILIARQCGFIPVVDFQNFRTYYNESHIINNTYNAWEYYFKQVSPYSLSEVYKSYNVLFCEPNIAIQKAFNVNVHDKNIYDDYVQVHEYIHNKVNDFCKKHLTVQRTLGVHFRGKEMNISAGHAFAPTIRQMIKFIDKIICDHCIEKIFLVTEEKDYLNVLKKYYGDNLIFTDSFRVSKVNAYNIYPRNNHRYLLGLEVLIDAMLLAKCNGLLCGTSGVSSYAFDTNEKYEFMYQINNGLNFRNSYLARYSYHMKKQLPSFLGGLKGDLIKIL